ncbi:hypothetical protein CgunFtcFv8_009783 [Champsocephalus gunnari]|uniref:Uncharacterized protein n=1 Tax=Champsocephalus gunnari TaxID=52237 RepID=A0AAN8GZ06_CHAGU|nr:hypothetical protein CgunFtcFv8_009783 [Champsocephalus gunnari]
MKASLGASGRSFSAISSVSYHLSSAGVEREVGSGGGAVQKGEPKGGSILIKRPAAEPGLKIEKPAEIGIDFCRRRRPDWQQLGHRGNPPDCL